MNDKKLYIPCDDCKFVEDSVDCQNCEFEQALNDALRLKKCQIVTDKSWRDLVDEIEELKAELKSALARER